MKVLACRPKPCTVHPQLDGWNVLHSRQSAKRTPFKRTKSQGDGYSGRLSALRPVNCSSAELVDVVSRRSEVIRERRRMQLGLIQEGVAGWGRGVPEYSHITKLLQNLKGTVKQCVACAVVLE
jgi:hypothetical protein